MSKFECPVYSPEDLIGKAIRLPGMTFFDLSKKEKDFLALTKIFENTAGLSWKEEAALLLQIQWRIECDMGLIFLKAENDQTSKNYYLCLRLLKWAKKYKVDTTKWQEKFDILFPITFLREFNLNYYKEALEKMDNYSKKVGKDRWFDYWSIFLNWYKFSQEANRELMTLGVDWDELNWVNESIFVKFLWVYLQDTLDIAKSFLDGKSQLYDVPLWNEVTQWKRDFKTWFDKFSELEWQISPEVEKIQRWYNSIIESMNIKEAEIDLHIKQESERSMGWPKNIK